MTAASLPADRPTCGHQNAMNAHQDVAGMPVFMLGLALLCPKINRLTNQKEGLPSSLRPYVFA
jgi:hypothetical protein